MNLDIQKNELHYFVDLLRMKNTGQRDSDQSKDCVQALYNIIRTMCLSRHDRLCSEDFSQLDFGNIPLNKIYFSLNGKCPSDFSRCKLNELNFTSGHSSAITGILYANNRNEIITGSVDKVVVWDIDTGLVKRQIYENVMSLMGSKYGNVFVTGSPSGIVTMRDIKTGEVLQTFKGHKGNINSIFFTDTEEQMVTGSSDGKTILWDIETGKIIKEFIVRDRSVKYSAILPDGKKMVVMHDDGIVKLLDIDTGNIIREYIIHDKAISSLVVLPDGRKMITAFDDTLAILWDIDTGNIIRKFDAHNRTITSISITQNGLKLLTGSILPTDFMGSRAILWDVNSGNIIWEHEYSRSYINSVAISPDSKTCLIGDFYGNFTSHNMEDGKMIQRYEGHSEFSNDGAIIDNNTKLLLFSNGPNVNGPIVTLWNIKTGKLIRKFQHHTNYITSFFIVPNEKMFITASDDGTIVFWDISTGEAVDTVCFQDSIHSISFLPNKNKLLIITHHAALLWDIETQKEDYKYAEFGDYRCITTAAISPDKKIAVIVFYRQNENVSRIEVCFYYLEDGKLAYSFSKNNLDVCTVDFSSDANECVLSFPNDDIVIFLDLVTWKRKKIDCSIELYNVSYELLWKNKERAITWGNGQLNRYLHSRGVCCVSFNCGTAILIDSNSFPRLLRNITDINISGCIFNDVKTDDLSSTMFNDVMQNDSIKSIIYQHGGEINIEGSTYHDCRKRITLLY